MHSDALLRLGWSPWFAARFAPYQGQDLEPGRVSADYGEALAVSTTTGDVTGRVTGKMRHEATGRAERPGVGGGVAPRREPHGGGTRHAGTARERGRAATGGAGRRDQGRR